MCTSRILSALLLATAVHGATPEQVRLWSEDLEYLQSRIQLLHPLPSDAPGKQALNTGVQEVRKRLSNLNLHSFALELSALVAKLGDAHTRLLLNSVAPAFTALPLRLAVYADGIYITGASKDYQQFMGAKVVRLGHLTPGQALDRLKAFVSAENDRWFLQSVPQRLILAEFLAEVGATAAGGQVTLTVTTKTGEAEVAISPGGSTVLQTLSTAPVPLRSSRPGSKYWFSEIDKRSILYVRLSEVADDAQENVRTFAARLKGSLSNGQHDRVIMDLRGNGGGNYLLARPLLHALLQVPDLADTGRLIVLIDRGTFSAAVMFAADLEKHFNPVFIGEPTGNSPNFSAEPVQITLPHTGMRFLCSTATWVNTDPRDRRKWISPLAAVEATWEDELAGRDRALEEAIAWKPQVGLLSRLQHALESGGISAMQLEYETFRADPKNKWFDAEGALSTLAYRVLRNQQVKAALALFELNVREHPKSAAAHSSLAGTVLNSGDKVRAVELYRLALKIDPRHYPAFEALERLQTPPRQRQP